MTTTDRTGPALRHGAGLPPGGHPHRAAGAVLHLETVAVRAANRCADPDGDEDGDAGLTAAVPPGVLPADVTAALEHLTIAPGAARDRRRRPTYLGGDRKEPGV